VIIPPRFRQIPERIDLSSGYQTGRKRYKDGKRI